MSQAYQYFVSFAPILAGLVAMFAIMRLKVGNSRVRLLEPDLSAIGEESEKYGREMDFRLLKQERFEELATEIGIINGMRPGWLGKEAAKTAFERIGLIDAGNTEILRGTAPRNHGKIMIFAGRCPMVRITRFGWPESAFLAYATDHEIEVLG